MKREELRELGLSDEAVQAIMTMHGKTVTDLKGQIEELTNERDVATENVNKFQEELTTMKENVKDKEELTAKLQDLQTKYDTVKTEGEAKLSELGKDYAIKLALKDIKAHDTDIVMGLLNRDAINLTDDGIKGLSEQIEKVKESKPFLFDAPAQEEKKPAITVGGNPQAGTTVQNYDLSKMSFAELKQLKEERPDVFKQLT